MGAWLVAWGTTCAWGKPHRAPENQVMDCGRRSDCSLAGGAGQLADHMQELGGLPLVNESVTSAEIPGGGFRAGAPCGGRAGGSPSSILFFSRCCQAREEQRSDSVFPEPAIVEAWHGGCGVQQEAVHQAVPSNPNNTTPPPQIPVGASRRALRPPSRDWTHLFMKLSWTP